jgi:hypothetical protein
MPSSNTNQTVISSAAGEMKAVRRRFPVLAQCASTALPQCASVRFPAHMDLAGLEAESVRFPTDVDQTGLIELFTPVKKTEK